MLQFNKRVLFVGFGAVARCTLPILVKHVGIQPGNITIMDFERNEAALKPWLEQGMKFIQDRITPANLGSFLGAAFITLTPILLEVVLAELNAAFNLNLDPGVTSMAQLLVFGGLIIFFLIVEPHGLARLWQITKEKLRLWPFPY